MAAAHKNEKPGDAGKEMHDHRFFEGMPGMGMMKNMTPAAMWMQGEGWMKMNECHHCSMPLPGDGAGLEAWKASTVSAEGWTMRVRCALCARDMSAETKGRAVLHLSTEKPETIVTVDCRRSRKSHHRHAECGFHRRHWQSCQMQSMESGFHQSRRV